MTVELGEDGKPTFWTLRLDRYQRDNLAWLLQCVLGPDPVEPFQMANSGDWAGEISHMLNPELDHREQPNFTVPAFRDMVKAWVRRKALTMIANGDFDLVELEAAIRQSRNK